MGTSPTSRIPRNAVIALRGDGTISICGKPLKLEDPKRAILAFLIKRVNTCVTKNEILRHLDKLGLAPTKRDDLSRDMSGIRRSIDAHDVGPSVALWFIDGTGYILSVNTSANRPLYQTLGLPHPKERWTIARKELLIDAIRNRKLTLEEAISIYPNTDKEEILGWMARFERRGRKGLKVSVHQRWL